MPWISKKEYKNLSERLDVLERRTVIQSAPRGWVSYFTYTRDLGNFAYLAHVTSDEAIKALLEHLKVTVVKHPAQPGKVVVEKTARK